MPSKHPTQLLSPALHSPLSIRECKKGKHPPIDFALNLYLVDQEAQVPEPPELYLGEKVKGRREK